MDPCIKKWLNMTASRSSCIRVAIPPIVQRIKRVLSEEGHQIKSKIGAWRSVLLQSGWKESIFSRAKLEKGYNAAGKWKVVMLLYKVNCYNSSNLYAHVIVLTDAEVRCSQKLTDTWEGIEKRGGGGINGRGWSMGRRERGT